MSVLVWTNDQATLVQLRTWVRGWIVGVSFVPGSDRLAILDQGPNAYAVIDMVSREYIACCPDEAHAILAAFGVLTREMAGAVQVLRLAEQVVGAINAMEIEDDLLRLELVPLLLKIRAVRGVKS